MSADRANAAAVREALVADAGEIVRVNNANLGQAGFQGGFLLDALAEPAVRRVLSRGGDRIWVEVAEGSSANAIRGFVWVSPAVESEVLEAVRWGDRRWEKELQGGKARYVRKIAVVPACRGLGVGERLYRHVFQQCCDQLFYCFVARAPRDNRESLAFHRALGFESVGEFRAEEFHGLRHYRSDLLVRHAREG